MHHSATMPGTAAFISNPIYLAILGAGIMCAASLSAAVAVGSQLGFSPGRRALFHWTPIAAAVFMARIMGWPDIAIGIIFGTSVAVLSTAVGSLCTIAPVGPAPARWKRLWPFTLVAAMIVFVSGFNGLLTWRHGVALGLEGLVILSLWRDPTAEHDWVPPILDPSRPIVPNEIAWLVSALSLFIAAAGAYLAVRGTVGMTHLRFHASPGALAASLLSLALITPLVQSGRPLAAVGASWIPMTAQVGVVLLNLCVLLPAIALAPYAGALLHVRTIQVGGRMAFDWDSFAPQATIFPLAAWRIDTVVIIILSTLLLPVAVGKWNLGKEEGMLLIVGYCVYLLAVMVAGI